MENLFLVCLIPPASIVEDIVEIRKAISSEFNVHESLKRPVHITLYNPVKITSKAEEQHFFDALEQASYAEPFTQTVKNFDAFAEHTFYIAVEQTVGIVNLEKEIRTHLKPLKLSSKNDNFKFTPHLTLAFRDVTPTVFRQISTAFKDKKFKREFMVSGFSIYKHIDKKWQPYREISFKSTNNKPKSLTLF